MTAPALGVLDIPERGAAFLRRRSESYLPADGDLHVPPRLIQEAGLRIGDEIAGVAGRPQGRGRGPALEKVTTVNGRSPESICSRWPRDWSRTSRG